MSYSGKIVRRALQRFEEDKRDRESRAQDRRESVFRREPRLREIDGELRATMSRILSAALRREADRPDELMMEDTIPWAMLNRAVMISIPWDTAAWASTKRTRHLTACSGLRISAKLPMVFTTPITKNSTSRA